MKYIIISETNTASRNIGRFLEKMKVPASVKVIKTKNSVLALEDDLKNINAAEIIIVLGETDVDASVLARPLVVFVVLLQNWRPDERTASHSIAAPSSSPN